MAYVVLVLRAFLAGVFVVSATGKAHSPSAFRGFTRSVRRIGRVPEGLAGAVAVAVIATEAAVAVLLAVPAGGPAGFLLALGLLTVFSAALASELRRGSTASCRCFGRDEEIIGPRHLGRNGVLLAASAAGAVLAPGVAGAPIPPAAAVLCLAGAAVATGITVLLDDLLYLLG